MGLDPTPRRRSKRLVVAGLVLVGLLTLGIFLWLFFAPWGTGEVRPSPDGRWVAMAVNIERRTLWRGKVHYLKLSVEEKSSGRVVWEVIHEHEPGAEVPNFSEPDTKFIVWSADSSEVTFPVGGGIRLTVPAR